MTRVSLQTLLDGSQQHFEHAFNLAAPHAVIPQWDKSGLYHLLHFIHNLEHRSHDHTEKVREHTCFETQHYQTKCQEILQPREQSLRQSHQAASQLFSTTPVLKHFQLSTYPHSNSNNSPTHAYKCAV